MSVYVGIDVHRKRSQVAVVTEDGQVQLNKNVVNGSGPFLRLIGDLPAGTPVAFGAAFGWSWLADLLEDYGFDRHLVHPLRCKAIASARLKNDKGRRGDPGAAAARRPAARGVDRPGGRPAAPRPDPAPDQPGPPRHRPAQPDPRGRRRPRLRPVRQLPGPGQAAAGWPSRVLPPSSREIVTDCLAVIDGLEPLTDRIDGELHARAKAGPRVKILRTLPGVGEFTALVMLAGIGDISRFGGARKLASWAGLTPTVRGPGPDRPARPHPGQGPAWLRWVLNQAAQTAKRSPEFAATCANIAKRRGKKIATTAISRKLLTRACHLLAGMQATDANAPLPRP